MGPGAERWWGVLGTKSPRSWKIVTEYDISFALDVMQWVRFCNSTVFYYKHSYSPTGLQFQTSMLSDFLNFFKFLEMEYINNAGGSYDPA